MHTENINEVICITLTHINWIFLFFIITFQNGAAKMLLKLVTKITEMGNNLVIIILPIVKI